MEMDVFVGERLTEFTYGLLNSVYIQEVNFMEEPGGKVLASAKAVVLSEN